MINMKYLQYFNSNLPTSDINIKILDMNIIPDYLIAMALKNRTIQTTPKQYTIAERNSDCCLGYLKNQPGVSENNSNSLLPQSEKKGNYSTDTNEENLGNFFKVDIIAPSTNDENELTLILKENNQIHYIFITDDFGKIWYENEINPFLQTVRINTNLFPAGGFNILIENNGSFSVNRFEKPI